MDKLEVKLRFSSAWLVSVNVPVDRNGLLIYEDYDYAMHENDTLGEYELKMGQDIVSPMLCVIVVVAKTGLLE